MISKDFFYLLATGIITALLGAAAGYYVGYDIGWEKAMVASVGNFEECAAAGNPVMESYPRQCRTGDGRHFIERVNQPGDDAGAAGGTWPASEPLPEGWTDTP